MTIDRSKEIRIPVFWVSFFAPFLLALITSLLVNAADKAESETRTKRNETDIEILRVEKASKEDFKLILEELRALNSKFDNHVNK